MQNRSNNTEKNRSNLSWKEGWLACIYILLSIITGIGTSILGWVKRRSFDAELWKAQHNTDALEGDNPRNGMVSILKRDLLKNGMLQNVVQDLLGKPEYNKNNSDHYELGRSLYGISYEHLVVEYEAGKLVRVFLLRY